jgi:hypothetical protein
MRMPKAMNEQWIKGIPAVIEPNRLYAVLGQPNSGYSVGVVIRGEDCNWRARDIIGHYPLPLVMNSAEASRIKRTGQYSWPAPATFLQQYQQEPYNEPQPERSHAERVMELIEQTPDGVLVPEPEDELYPQGVALIQELQQASISALQRRLRIGYNRASRMMENMQAAGIVSEADTMGHRTVLATKAPQP